MELKEPQVERSRRQKYWLLGHSTSPVEEHDVSGSKQSCHAGYGGLDLVLSDELFCSALLIVSRDGLTVADRLARSAHKNY